MKSAIYDIGWAKGQYTRVLHIQVLSFSLVCGPSRERGDKQEKKNEIVDYFSVRTEQAQSTSYSLHDKKTYLVYKQMVTLQFENSGGSQPTKTLLYKMLLAIRRERTKSWF